MAWGMVLCALLPLMVPVGAEEVDLRSAQPGPSAAAAYDLLDSDEIPAADALRLAPDLEVAQGNMERAQLYVRGTFDRLLAHLAAVPERWQSIRDPLVPMSGRAPAEVLNTSSEEEDKQALIISHYLTFTPSDERNAAINELLKTIKPTEVDLWMPLSLAQQERVTNPAEAVLTVEAWLVWAEALRRQDVLLVAASFGMNLVLDGIGPNSVLPTARAWMQLPEAPRTENSRAQLWRFYAELLFRIGDTRNALEEYRKARSLFEATQDLVGQGNAWYGEADILLFLGDNEKALSSYRKARTLFETLEVPIARINQAYARLGEAQALFRINQNRASLEAYRQARISFESFGEQQGQGNAWDGEADVLFLLGENEEALDAHGKARTFFEAVGDHIGQGHTWTGQATILLHLGEMEQALVAYEEARAHFEFVGDNQGQGNSWDGEADVLFRLGENERALNAYGKARVFFETIGDLLGVGSTYEGEAGVYSRLGEHEKALAAIEKARSLFERMGCSLSMGNTFYDEAKIWRRLGDWSRAAEAAAAAAAYFQEAGSIASRSEALLIEAEARMPAGQVEKAAALAEGAISLHNHWRKSRITDVHRTDTDQRIYRAYDVLVPLRVRQPGRSHEALTLAEEARSRVLLDLLATPALRVRAGDVSNLEAELTRIREELAGIEIELTHSSDPSQRLSLNKRRRRLDRALLWNRYQRIAKQENAFPVSEALKAGAIRNLARETGPILLYYAAPFEIVGFLILPDREKPVTELIDMNWDQLTHRVGALASALGNPVLEARAGTHAQQLWEHLIAPFADKLPAGGPLTVIPHGPLHGLPFEALRDRSGNPLFERWKMSTAPSVSVLARCRERHAVARRDDVMLTFSSGQGLSRTEHEATEIARLFEVSERAEDRFHQYVSKVPQPRQIFIATRGVHEQGSRTGTYLELIADENHDRRLTAAEIATIPINAELVTLAACDTAAGRALLSDERLDLTRAFLIAGATSVLATRWRVPDSNANSRFLIDFYRAYRRGGPDGKGMRKDEALTVARRLSRDRGDPAQVWAAWVLVGDPR